MRNIELHIEELVLEGFPPHERHRIAEAMTQRFEELFKQKGVAEFLSRGGEVRQLDGGAFELRPNSKAETTGTQVAEVVYGSLRR